MGACFEKHPTIPYKTLITSVIQTDFGGKIPKRVKFIEISGNFLRIFQWYNSVEFSMHAIKHIKRLEEISLVGTTRSVKYSSFYGNDSFRSLSLGHGSLPEISENFLSSSDTNTSSNTKSNSSESSSNDSEGFFLNFFLNF